MVLDLFRVQRQFLLSSCRNRTPSAGTGPTQAHRIHEVRQLAAQDGSEAATGSHLNHLRFIAETIGAVGWIVAGKRPALFIRESYDAGKRFVKEIKKAASKSSTPALHSDWIRAWQEVILDLEAFVREWHPTGIIWGKE